MKETIKATLHSRMLSVAKKAYETNPMKGSPMEGLMIQDSIGIASKSYKEELILNKEELKMSEDEIIIMVDEVTTEILDMLFK